MPEIYGPDCPFCGKATTPKPRILTSYDFEAGDDMADEGNFTYEDRSAWRWECGCGFCSPWGVGKDFARGATKNTALSIATRHMEDLKEITHA